MITYIKEDNSIQSYFGHLTDNEDAFYYWYHELSKYFNKHYIRKHIRKELNIYD